MRGDEGVAGGGGLRAARFDDHDDLVAFLNLALPRINRAHRRADIGACRHTLFDQAARRRPRRQRIRPGRVKKNDIGHHFFRAVSDYM